MIELAAAATVAALVSNAVGAFDKIYRGYSDFIKEKEPASYDVPPPDFAYVDSPENKALVAKSVSTGAIYQTVTYDQLRSRLSEQELEFLESLTSAMETYQMQWNSAVKQKAMASGMDIGKMEAQQKYLAEEISKVLLQILELVERLGLHLHDHYHIARMVAKDYLKEQAA